METINNKVENDIKKGFAKRNKRFKETIKLILDDNGEYDYVVFSKDNDAALSMSPMAYESLQQIITSNGSSINNNTNGVFFNKNGPTTLTGSVKGDIYMECLPTGSEGETLVPLAKNSEQMFNTQTIKNIFKNNIVLQILTGILIMLALTKIGQWILNKLTSEKVQNGGIRSGSMRSGSMQGGSIKKLITQMRKHK